MANEGGQGKRDVLLELIALRFGEITDDAAARVERASADELARYLRQVLSAATIDAVFAQR